MKYLNVELVKQIGKLLACRDATHPDFFTAVWAELETRGYCLRVRDRGINGIEITIHDDHAPDSEHQ